MVRNGGNYDGHKKDAYFNLIRIIVFPVFVQASGYDSLNVSYVGNWPFGACFSVSADPSRNLVFLGSGGGVYIYNVSNPSNPVKISEKIHTRGVADVFYDSSTQRLYTASGSVIYSRILPGVLEIWDISDPSNPSKLGNYWIPGSARAVHTSGSYAYIADGDSGLRIIDISDPSAPFEVAFIDTLSDAYDVFVSGSYAYVPDRDAGLQIYNNNLLFVEESPVSPISDIYDIQFFIPNPIKPGKIIYFILPQKTKGKLNLFDLIGRKIEIIKNGYFNAGKNSFNIGKDIKSGVYFLKLEGENIRAEKKLVVVK